MYLTLRKPNWSASKLHRELRAPGGHQAGLQQGGRSARAPPPPASERRSPVGLSCHPAPAGAAAAPPSSTASTCPPARTPHESSPEKQDAATPTGKRTREQRQRGQRAEQRRAGCPRAPATEPEVRSRREQAGHSVDSVVTEHVTPAFLPKLQPGHAGGPDGAARGETRRGARGRGARALGTASEPAHPTPREPAHRDGRPRRRRYTHHSAHTPRRLGARHRHRELWSQTELSSPRGVTLGVPRPLPVRSPPRGRGTVTPTGRGSTQVQGAAHAAGSAV